MVTQAIWQHPDPDARGWTRWWWYGCAVTRGDIAAQLREMADAHIGGVEIQITYPLDRDRQPEAAGEAASRHIEFFSPAFFDILAFTVEAAHALGIRVDLTLGSGWPFGGPFITQDMAPVALLPYAHDVQGPASFSFDYTCVLAGKIARCILVRIENGVMLPDTAQDITAWLKPVELYGWPWGVRLENVPVPQGQYKVYTFVESRYRQTVGIPSPGMEGFAIDHCRKDVCDLYFHTMGDTLLEKLGEGAFHGFFCDSIELGGNNWTGDLPEAFRARRGYDLTPYMPALWGDMGEATARVRYDYYLTFSELTLESFFENFHDHCARWNVQSRIQAHGIWADILKAYGAAHIPEGETFGPHDRYDVNVIHRRLAVSAGLVYGRPIVSNESFTWLRMPRFLVTPDMIKRAVDAIFCDGINRVVNHGWSYSPLSEGKPGWPFYASTMLSMNNTWWPYYPELGAYIHRVSALMQAGQAFSEVAIYLPQADVWADSPMAELHMCMKLDAYLGHELVNALQRAGYWFTFVNDEALQQGQATPEGLQIGVNTYRAVLLINARRLPVETAAALDRFVRAGGSLLAAGGVPQESPGLLNAADNDAAVRSRMQGLFAETAGEWHGVGAGHAAACEATAEAVERLLSERVAPLLQSDHADTLGYIRRTVDGRAVYFIANMSQEGYTARLSLPHAGEGFALADLLTGEAVLPLSIEDKDGRLLLAVDIEANQSFALEIGGERPACRQRPTWTEVSPVTGWRLTVDGQQVAEGLEAPVGWEGFEASKYHCGEGVYEADFDAPQGDAPLFLQLTQVDCCAAVYVNGEAAGRLWKAPYALDISALVRPGRNALRIVAVNTWVNAFLDPANRVEPSDKPVLDSWPYFARVVDQPRGRRIDGWREREMLDGVQPSGIRGPVRLMQTQP